MPGHRRAPASTAAVSPCRTRPRARLPARGELEPDPVLGLGVGRPRCARRTSPSSSTIRGSSSCPGSRSPISARTSWPSSDGACPWTGPSATAPRPCLSKPSSRPRDTPAPSTGRPAGSMSGPPRGVGAMIETSSTTSRKRTSGSGPSERTGNALSIDRSRQNRQAHHGLKERLRLALPSANHVVVSYSLRLVQGDLGEPPQREP